MVFLKKNKLTNKLISVIVNEFAVEFKTFVLTTLEKYQNFYIWVLGPRPMTLENLHFEERIKKTLDKWKQPLFFKIFFIHVYERG